MSREKDKWNYRLEVHEICFFKNGHILKHRSFRRYEFKKVYLMLLIIGGKIFDYFDTG